MIPDSLSHTHTHTLIQVCAITGSIPGAHGAPLCWGEQGMRQLGINDLAKPEYGDAVDVVEGEVPVFWACGVTTQSAIKSAGDKVSLAITHAPGHMAVLALRDEDLIV